MDTLIESSGCTQIDGACGALRFMTQNQFLRIIEDLFLFSFVGISLRRARDIGLYSGSGLLLPLLIFAFVSGQTGTLTMFLNSAGFGRGLFAVLTLIFASFLCLMPSGGEAKSSKIPMTLLYVSISIAAIASTFKISIAISDLPEKDILNFSIQSLRNPLFKFFIFKSEYIFTSALILPCFWLLWAQKAALLKRTAKQQESSDRLLNRYSNFSVLIAFIIVMLTYFVLSLDGESFYSPDYSFSLISQQFILPTILIYSSIIMAIFYFRLRRSKVSVAILLATTMPFGIWAYEHLAIWQLERKEVLEIASIPTLPLQNAPDTIVSKSTSFVVSDFWRNTNLQHFIRLKSDGSMFQYDRPARNRSGKGVRISQLPNQYLIIETDKKSRYYKEVRNSEGGLQGSTDDAIELRLIAPDQDSLIGLWVHTNWFRPTPLPLLAKRGWVRKKDQSDVPKRMKLADFLQDYLPDI